ncbi:uncharacterized protein LOC125067485 [Vanessa atalanta]|uniref:uncharacterized protein LOC125067485 n=1 Tax=Vanessa atalanta TaxID=42275 RepID=UPI001FCCE705|nr:uncharacterized protein LOC125067485 [Vanessa atalanta]
MFTKTMFLFVILVLQCTLGFPQNAGFNPSGIAGSFLKPIKDVKEKQIMPVVGLFQEPLGAFSKASHGILKRATDEDKSSGMGSFLAPIKEVKDKQIQPIFGLFGEQIDKVSKVFDVFGSPSSKKE